MYCRSVEIFSSKVSISEVKPETAGTRDVKMIMIICLFVSFTHSFDSGSQHLRPWATDCQVGREAGTSVSFCERRTTGGIHSVPYFHPKINFEIVVRIPTVYSFSDCSRFPVTHYLYPVQFELTWHSFFSDNISLCFVVLICFCFPF